MSFPLPPENWDPNDEYGRAQINEFLLAVYGALQRERVRVNELVENAGVSRPSPFVGHPGYPGKTECIPFGEPLPLVNDGALTRVGRVAVQSVLPSANTPLVWTQAFSDDDAIFVNGSGSLVVSAGGTYNLAIHVRFESSGVGCRRVRILVNGVVVAEETIEACTSDVTVVSVSGSRKLVATDVVTADVFQSSPMSLNVGGPFEADLALSLYRYPSAVAQGTSQCYDVSFSGVPGNLTVPGGGFPVFAVAHDVFWTEEGFEGRGNGDVVVVLGSAGIAGGDGGPISILFTFALPRGFSGWASNAIVFRYGVHFEGVPASPAGDAVATLIATDTRNDNPTVPVPGFSSFTDAPAAGIVDVPYGRELTVTRDQLAEIAGFREGTGIRILFSLSVPEDHNVGATVTFGHLELNYA